MLEAFTESVNMNCDVANKEDLRVTFFPLQSNSPAETLNLLHFLFFLFSYKQSRFYMNVLVRIPEHYQILIASAQDDTLVLEQKG